MGYIFFFKTNNLGIPVNECYMHSDNQGKVPLEIIEVKSGSYLGEDDIVRFDDIYEGVTK